MSFILDLGPVAPQRDENLLGDIMRARAIL